MSVRTKGAATYIVIISIVFACCYWRWRSRSRDDEGCAEGELVCDPKSFEILGKNVSGDFAWQTLKLSNKGKDHIAIHAIRTTCGCVRLQPMDVERIEPGNEYEIKFSARIPQSGRVSGQRIAISYSCPAEGSRTVYIPVSVTGKSDPPYLFDNVKVDVELALGCRDAIRSREIELSTHESIGDNSREWVTDEQSVSVKQMEVVERRLNDTVCEKTYRLLVSLDKSETRDSGIARFFWRDTYSKHEIDLGRIRWRTEERLKCFPQSLVFSEKRRVAKVMFEDRCDIVKAVTIGPTSSWLRSNVQYSQTPSKSVIVEIHATGDDLPQKRLNERVEMFANGHKAGIDVYYERE